VAKGRKPQGIDLQPILDLMSRLGLGGSMSTPTSNPREAVGRSMNRRGSQAVIKTGRTVANETSALFTPYSLDEWQAIRDRGGLSQQDALWAALYAAPLTRPIKRARNAFRAGRTALKGVSTPPTGSLQTAGMAQEPSGELEYQGLTALLKLLEGK